MRFTELRFPGHWLPGRLPGDWMRTWKLMPPTKQVVRVRLTLPHGRILLQVDGEQVRAAGGWIEEENICPHMGGVEMIPSRDRRHYAFTAPGWMLELAAREPAALPNGTVLDAVEYTLWLDGEQVASGPVRVVEERVNGDQLESARLEALDTGGLYLPQFLLFSLG